MSIKLTASAMFNLRRVAAGSDVEHLTLHAVPVRTDDDGNPLVVEQAPTMEPVSCLTGELNLEISPRLLYWLLISTGQKLVKTGDYEVLIESGYPFVGPSPVSTPRGGMMEISRMQFCGSDLVGGGGTAAVLGSIGLESIGSDSAPPRLVFRRVWAVIEEISRFSIHQPNTSLEYISLPWGESSQSPQVTPGLSQKKPILQKEEHMEFSMNQKDKKIQQLQSALDTAFDRIQILELQIETLNAALREADGEKTALQGDVGALIERCIQEKLSALESTSRKKKNLWSRLTSSGKKGLH